MHFLDGSQATSCYYSTKNVLKTKYCSKPVENWNQSVTLVTSEYESYRDCLKLAG